MELVQIVLGFLLALFVLVSVHEFGHYFVARRCGVKVLRFSIGMGKPFWSYRDRHGTEFALAPIPLGGYVKMLDEREVEVPPEQRHQSYNSKTVWQRISILVAGPAANFLLAVLIFWAVLGFQGTIGLSPVIGHIEPDSPAAEAGLEPGQQIIAVDDVPTETRRAVMERLIGRLGETGTLSLSVKQSDSDLRYDTDVVLNQWLRGARDPDPVAGLGLTFYYPPISVMDVGEGTPAEAAGLLPGDELLRIDGQDIYTMEWWIDYVRQHPGVPLTVEVLRDQQRHTLEVVPASVALEDGSMGGQMGVSISYGSWPEGMVLRENFGLIGALGQGATKTWETTQFVLMSLKKLIVGEISPKNLSGPIGIAKVAGDHAKAGWIYYIEFLAILSIYLGVLNLLPIPVLDGGHIVYCLIEAVKGSPVSERAQMLGYSAGLVLLVGIMMVALYNDILRF